MAWAESLDRTFRILAAQWTYPIGAGRVAFQLLPQGPPGSELRVDFFGTDIAIPAAGAWGLRSGGREIPEYGFIGAGISIGTVEVPILTVEVHLFSDLVIWATSAPIVAFVRVKASYIERRDAQEARVNPPSGVDRVLSSIANIWRGEL